MSDSRPPPPPPPANTFRGAWKEAVQGGEGTNSSERARTRITSGRERADAVETYGHVFLRGQRVRRRHAEPLGFACGRTCCRESSTSDYAAASGRPGVRLAGARAFRRTADDTALTLTEDFVGQRPHHHHHLLIHSAVHGKTEGGAGRGGGVDDRNSGDHDVVGSVRSGL